MKQSFDKVKDDMQEVYSAQNKYGKALDKKFKNLVLPSASNDPLSSHPTLTNRAIAMHLLREGQFGVATTFIDEVNAKPPPSSHTEEMPASSASAAVPSIIQEDAMLERSWAHDFAGLAADVDAMDSGEEGGVGFERSPGLQERFTEMYHILRALRNDRNLDPAIQWAKEHSEALEARGSNLEFELCRLRFVELYCGGGQDRDAVQDGEGLQNFSGPLRALQYARETFPSFSTRFTGDSFPLLGSLVFYPSLESSPYKHVFFNDGAWEDAANSFVREFCGMLGLSDRSPLYTAVTAGGIALPVLEKLERVMDKTGGQWTSANELPVEIPLPPSYLFHSIFVCPVSKEQGTDLNPPMMMPCGHVIAKESLEKVSRGNK